MVHFLIIFHGLGEGVCCPVRAAGVKKDLYDSHHSLAHTTGGVRFLMNKVPLYFYRGTSLIRNQSPSIPINFGTHPRADVPPLYDCLLRACWSTGSKRAFCTPSGTLSKAFSSA